MSGPDRGLGDQLRGLADALAGVLGDSAGGDHAAECRTCPLCTGLAVLRGRRPDLSAALADLLDTAASALRDLAAPATAPAPTADEPEPAPAPAPVQRIDVA